MDLIRGSSLRWLQTWVSIGSRLQSANTKYESAAMAPSRRKWEVLLNWHLSWEATRSSQNITKNSLVHFFSMKSGPAKMSEDQESIAMLTSAKVLFTVYWVLLLLYPNIPCLSQENITWHNWVSKETRNFHFTLTDHGGACNGEVCCQLALLYEHCSSFHRQKASDLTRQGELMWPPL